MALQDFMVNGSYAFISTVNIDKNSKSVQFTIDVFQDDSKLDLLFSRTFFLSCLTNYRPATSVSKLQSDGTEVDGDYYFVPSNATGDWAVHAGKYLQYMNQGESLSTIPHESTEGEIIQIPSGQVYRINGSKMPVLQIAGTMAVWNTFFAFEVSTAANTNLIKQCYEFLKTTPIAVGATDI